MSGDQLLQPSGTREELLFQRADILLGDAKGERSNHMRLSLHELRHTIPDCRVGVPEKRLRLPPLGDQGGKVQQVAALRTPFCNIPGKQIEGVIHQRPRIEKDLKIRREAEFQRRGFEYTGQEAVDGLHLHFRILREHAVQQEVCALAGFGG